MTATIHELRPVITDTPRPLSYDTARIPPVADFLLSVGVAPADVIASRLLPDPVAIQLAASMSVLRASRP